METLSSSLPPWSAALGRVAPCFEFKAQARIISVIGNHPPDDEFAGTNTVLGKVYVRISSEWAMPIPLSRHESTKLGLCELFSAASRPHRQLVDAETRLWIEP